MLIHGQYEGATPFMTKEVYYTGKDVNATASSRAAIAEDIAPTYVVVYDMYGHDKGRGIDVTKPVTSMLDYFAGIVWKVPTDSKRGGWITIITAATVVKARTNAVQTNAPTTRILLGPSNGNWGLTAVTLSVASGAANFLALVQAVAQALESTDTSGTAAVKDVMLLRPGTPIL